MNSVSIICFSVLISVAANYWIFKDVVKGLDKLNRKCKRCKR